MSYVVMATTTTNPYTRNEQKIKKNIMNETNTFSFPFIHIHTHKNICDFISLTYHEPRLCRRRVNVALYFLYIFIYMCVCMMTSIQIMCHHKFMSMEIIIYG